MDADAVSYTESSSIFFNTFYSKLIFLISVANNGKWAFNAHSANKSCFPSSDLSNIYTCFCFCFYFYDMNRLYWLKQEVEERKRYNSFDSWVAPETPITPQKADRNNIVPVVVWTTHVEVSIGYRFLYLYRYAHST